jgi:hypothetical protein
LLRSRFAARGGASRSCRGSRTDAGGCSGGRRRPWWWIDQYIVVATSGGNYSGEYVAFTLPGR